MNVQFEQPYNQAFLDKAKAFYINASTYYTPIWSIICAISAIPSLIIHGANARQLIPLLCIVACGIISFLIQKARADQIFKSVEPANDNLSCVVDMTETNTDYCIKTNLNTIRQYHLTNKDDIKELFLGNSKAIIVLDEMTILPFGFTAEDKETKKQYATFFRNIRKTIQQPMVSSLYRMFRLVLILFIVVNIMSIAA